MKYNIYLLYLKASQQNYISKNLWKIDNPLKLAPANIMISQYL